VAAYTVEARSRVRKALRQLDPKVRRDVLTKMRALATDPRPPGAEALQGYPPWLRVRAGDYRIIYAVDDQARTVTVAIVGHRREVYRRLDL
jgi:mRNA interferase RelE/StbE